MKQQIRKPLSAIDFDAEKPCSIEDAIRLLSDAKTNGATFVDWSASKDYDGFIETVTAEPYYTALETDEEEALRLASEAAHSLPGRTVKVPYHKLEAVLKIINEND